MTPHIPNELIARISDFTDLQTLKHLRLTTSAFRGAVELRFATCLESIHVEFTEVAVQNLSRKVVTPWIRATVKELVLRSSDSSRKELDDHRVGFGLIHRLVKYVNSSLPTCRILQLYLRTARPRKADERLKFSHDNVRMFSYVMLRHTPTLNWPFDNFRVTCRDPQRCLDRLVTIPLVVFKALQDAGAETNFHSLSKLYLPLYVHAGQHSDGSLQGCRSLWTILLSMPRLTHLDLGLMVGDEDLAEKVFIEMVRLGGNIPLRCLEIQGLFNSLNPIEQFLAHHGARINTLKLQVRIPVDGLESAQRLVDTLIEQCRMLHNLHLTVWAGDREWHIAATIRAVPGIDRDRPSAVTLAHETLTKVVASASAGASRWQLANTTQVAIAGAEPAHGQEQDHDMAQAEDDHDDGDAELEKE